MIPAFAMAAKATTAATTMSHILILDGIHLVNALAVSATGVMVALNRSTPNTDTMM